VKKKFRKTILEKDWGADGKGGTPIETESGWARYSGKKKGKEAREKKKNGARKVWGETDIVSSALGAQGGVMGGKPEWRKKLLLHTKKKGGVLVVIEIKKQEYTKGKGV